jgi:hypothetical protein
VQQKIGRKQAWLLKNSITFLDLTHFCGQRIGDKAFIVWRITARKRMVAKLKAIKAYLHRRRHHRTTAVGAGFARLCWLRWLWRSVLVRRSQCAQVRWDRRSAVLNRPQPAFCILTLMHASPPLIHEEPYG